MRQYRPFKTGAASPHTIVASQCRAHLSFGLAIRRDAWPQPPVGVPHPPGSRHRACPRGGSPPRCAACSPAPLPPTRVPLPCAPLVWLGGRARCPHRAAAPRRGARLCFPHTPRAAWRAHLSCGLAVGRDAWPPGLPSRAAAPSARYAAWHPAYLSCGMARPLPARTSRASWRARPPRAHHTSQGGPPRCVHRKSTLEAHFLSVLFFSQIYACQTSCSLVTFSPLSNNPCSGGGIGRHASLRCWSGFRLRVRVPPRAPFYDRMACHSVFFFCVFRNSPFDKTRGFC